MSEAGMTGLWVLVASCATAVLFNVPSRAVVVVPLAALAGSFTVQLLGERLAPPGCLFVAALAVATAAEGLARLQQFPALVYSVPGILPLVPGSVAYRGMALAVRGEHAAAAEQLSLALLSAGAIATGLLVAAAVWKLPARLMPRVLQLEEEEAPALEPEEPPEFPERSIPLAL